MLSLQTLQARDRPPHPAHALCADKPTSPQKRRGSVLQSDVEVPGPAGDDCLLLALSFPPAVGKVRPNTLRT